MPTRTRGPVPPEAIRPGPAGQPLAISVRLDDDAARALALLEATGLSRSEAIRRALVEEASRQRRSSALAAEAAALESDPADRDEMRAVAEFMGVLDDE